ncbi:hypothetical protein [Salmonirosea aquatica]|uniref:Uncharacterized protein n=1 Tax=Salmonirosea aquatica TaxID=2654236 RepID=A0A7C9BKU0_9BACT|nr:hypothetical protein [Cytophagaceae bacterium SJW1-29]
MAEIHYAPPAQSAEKVRIHLDNNDSYAMAVLIEHPEPGIVLYSNLPTDNAIDLLEECIRRLKS